MKEMSNQHSKPIYVIDFLEDDYVKLQFDKNNEMTELIFDVMSMKFDELIDVNYAYYTVICDESLLSDINLVINDVVIELAE